MNYVANPEWGVHKGRLDYVVLDAYNSDPKDSAASWYYNLGFRFPTGMDIDNNLQATADAFGTNKTAIREWLVRQRINGVQMVMYPDEIARNLRRYTIPTRVEDEFVWYLYDEDRRRLICRGLDK